MRERHSDTVALTAFMLLSVLIVGYLLSLLVRGSGSYWTWLDGWVVCAIELVASALCIARGLLRRPGRAAALVLGLALLSWTVGDIVLTTQSIGGATPPSPSIADAFYLGFYPLAYVAVLLFMRDQLRTLTATSWLDGAIAGLGAAATAAAFAFHTILHSTGGNRVATGINLALPIGDVLLLGLVAGGFAVLPGKRRAPWVLLGFGMALIAVGDTSNLFQNSLGATRVGTILNAVAWPAAIVMMSMAVWLREPASNPLMPQRPPRFILPLFAAAASLVILLVGTLHSIGKEAIALATATLLLVGVRLIITVRGMEVLSEERHRQSVTDELTGLWNRRYMFRVLDEYFAGRSDPSNERTLAFLFVDLDHFKEVNDTFGHPAGDELLRQLGARLASSLRDTDLLVRLGGDEFAVVLVDGDAEYATAVARRISASLNEPFMLDVVSATIGASIGIAMSPTDASDSTRLVWCADVAMYRAKLGKTAFACYEPSLDEEGDQLRLMEELRGRARRESTGPPLSTPTRPAHR